MEKTVAYLNNYMAVFDGGVENFSKDTLFYVTRKGTNTSMSDDNIRKFMKVYAASAREKCPDVPEKIYPPLWRHSRTIHLHRDEMDLTLLKEMTAAYGDNENPRRA